MQTDAGLATAMRISVTRLARRLRVERLGLGGSEAILSDIQLAALAALERHDAMTPGELAEHEKVQPPSMTRVIAVLEERGLVRRAAHPTDRRQVILTVTQQGRDVVQLVRRRREAWLAQRLQELTAEERATLLAAAPILEKLSQSLGAPGLCLSSGRLLGFWRWLQMAFSWWQLRVVRQLWRMPTSRPGRAPGSCSVGGRVFRRHASSCSDLGSIRPERTTITPMSGPAC